MNRINKSLAAVVFILVAQHLPVSAQWALPPSSANSTDAFTSSGAIILIIDDKIIDRYLSTKNQKFRTELLKKIERRDFRFQPPTDTKYIKFALTIIAAENQKKSWFTALNFALQALNSALEYDHKKDWAPERDTLKKAITDILIKSLTPKQYESIAAENFYPPEFISTARGKVILSALEWSKKFKWDANLPQILTDEYRFYEKQPSAQRLKTLCRPRITYEQWPMQADHVSLDSTRRAHPGYRLTRLYDLAASLPDPTVARFMCDHYEHCLPDGTERDADIFEDRIKVLKTMKSTSILKDTFQIDEAQCFIQLADADDLSDKVAKLQKASQLLNEAISELKGRHDKLGLLCLANAEYLMGLLYQRQGKFLKSSELLAASVSHFEAIYFKDHIRVGSALWWLATNALNSSDSIESKKYFAFVLAHRLGLGLLYPLNAAPQTYNNCPTSLDLLSLGEIYYSRVKNLKQKNICATEIRRIKSQVAQPDEVGSDGSQANPSFDSTEDKLMMTPDSYTGIPEASVRQDIIKKAGAL